MSIRKPHPIDSFEYALDDQENLDERKQRILSIFEKMREMTHDELVEFWHKLILEEAELIHELRNENQVLASIMGSSGLQLVSDDSTSDDNDQQPVEEKQ
ncbi:hypothetical protein KC878_02045 [Candidatus Saccharibacteria bacterium]|nr:hypothetical protein [Candidatus Saccharibacteria bacterium]MCB9821507.1 hypothetical protein [Candidatus Nomurabacteria bacterium]